MPDLDIYRISDHYIHFLHSRDNRVQFNKDRRRPYVGVVLFVGEYRYFVPMESPKPNHVNLKAGPHLYKLDGGALGLLGFNNMVPVPECALLPFDISTIADVPYRTLLQHQALAINNNQAAILHCASKTYFSVVNNTNKFLCRISCDFRALERACETYDPNRKPPER